jgi:steroid delta-isomerase-like uncharacterized protein
MVTEARTLVDRHYEGINSGDMDEALADHSDDVDVRMPGQGRISGRDTFRQFAQPFLTAFPNAKIHGDEYVEAGDTIVVEGRFTGENTGPLMTPMGELPPTGKSLVLAYADIFRVRDGKIVFHHVYFDNADFMQQLGL